MTLLDSGIGGDTDTVETRADGGGSSASDTCTYIADGVEVEAIGVPEDGVRFAV